MRDRLTAGDRDLQSRWDHICSSIVFFVCCGGSGLCGALITRPEESCRPCVCLIKCDLETSTNKAAWAHFGPAAQQKKKSYPSFRKGNYTASQLTSKPTATLHAIVFITQIFLFHFFTDPPSGKLWIRFRPLKILCSFVSSPSVLHVPLIATHSFAAS